MDFQIAMKLRAVLNIILLLAAFGTIHSAVARDGGFSGKQPVSLAIVPYSTPIVFKAGEKSSSFADFTVNYSDGGSAKVYANPYITGDMTQNLVKLASSNLNVLSFTDYYWYVAGNPVQDTPLTISASYTENGVTVSASVPATVLSAAVKPTALKLDCPAALASSSQGKCRAMALYSNGVSKTVAPVWSSSDASVLAVDGTGGLSAGNVNGDTKIIITANHTDADSGITVSGSVTVTVVSKASSLASLSLACPSTLVSGGSGQCSATAHYGDGSSADVSYNTLWSSSDYSVLSVQSTCSTRGCLKPGTLGAMTVAADTPAVITGKYSEKGIGMTATAQITVIVRSSNANQYQAFLAASPPGGFFYYDGSAWWPYRDTMTPFARNVAPWSLEQTALAVVSPYASQVPDGTAVYTGYGLSFTEMLDSARYKSIAVNRCSQKNGVTSCGFSSD